MKRIFLVLFAALFVFSFDLRAFAEKGYSHEKMNHETMNHEEMNMDHGSDHEGMDMKHDQGSNMKDMDHGIGSDMEGMNHDSGSDMKGMDIEEGSHDHHGPVVETAPNYKILGTYGGVNLAFIVIGIWNKWFRRKGGVNNGIA